MVGEPTGLAELTVALPAAGWIECGPKPGGYDDGDRELLTTLVGQASTAIANVALTAQLDQRLDELRASRARLVVAADAERRRIERDLHDGVQQHVVALMPSSGWPATGGRGEDVTARAGGRSRPTRETARRPAGDGPRHPPAGTRRQRAGGGRRVAGRRFPLPLRSPRADPGCASTRFAAELEATAYYVVCESLTNVIKHADASTSAVALTTGTAVSPSS